MVELGIDAAGKYNPDNVPRFRGDRLGDPMGDGLSAMMTPLRDAVDPGRPVTAGVSREGSVPALARDLKELSPTGPCTLWSVAMPGDGRYSELADGEPVAVAGLDDEVDEYKCCDLGLSCHIDLPMLLLLSGPMSLNRCGLILGSKGEPAPGIDESAMSL